MTDPPIENKLAEFPRTCGVCRATSRTVAGNDLWEGPWIRRHPVSDTVLRLFMCLHCSTLFDARDGRWIREPGPLSDYLPVGGASGA